MIGAFLSSPLQRALFAVRHPLRAVHKATTPPEKRESNKRKVRTWKGTFAYSKLNSWIASDFDAPQKSLGLDPDLTIPRDSLRSGRYKEVNFVAHNDYQAPDENVAFVTVINNKYSMGLEGLVLSLISTYPGFKNDFHVYHDESLSDFVRDRLMHLYPNFIFHKVDTARYDVGQIGDSVNHKRVGLLGYLTLNALELEGYEWVVLLDADTIVIGDISPLYTGEQRPKAVMDAGALPFTIVSASTGMPVLNSGVISLPAHMRGAKQHAEALVELSKVGENDDPAIRRFADQKFWNIYLAKHNLQFLPTNFNANHGLVERYFPESLHSVSLLHITGVKPWFQFVSSEEKHEDDNDNFTLARRKFPVTFALWLRLFGSGKRIARITEFRKTEGADLDALKDSTDERPAVMIGNGPSINETDLSLFDGFEKYAFNWFINHPEFDTVRPDHLVLASAKFFGGWHTSNPSWPAGYLDSLTSREHKPRLWVSYYFKPLIESTPELEGYEVSYFLFEKPFKPMLQKTGQVGLDLYSPLVDSLTGVLSAGVPIAIHLGAKSVVLVGCDSNYASQTGTYFYGAEKHTSPTNTTENLVTTWGSDASVGQYCYLRFSQTLEERGIRFADSTIGGALTTVPKLPITEVRSLLAK